MVCMPSPFPSPTKMRGGGRLGGKSENFRKISAGGGMRVGGMGKTSRIGEGGEG